MPDDRTLTTELLTGLGMLGIVSPVLAGQPFLHAAPPDGLRGVPPHTWERLRSLLEDGEYHRDAALALANGEAFLRSPDALRGRKPLRVEWTAARRPPGDETIPADLRVDHVYLISCKYLSRLLHNAGPSRLFEGLLTEGGQERIDWYLKVAPVEYQGLYQSCRHVSLGLPLSVEDLTTEQRRHLARELRGGWPTGAAERYQELATTVAKQSAEHWQRSLGRMVNSQRMLWRLLRIAPAPYFVLGTQREGSMRLRIDTPWDWHHRYDLKAFQVAADTAGQPRVGWSATCLDRETSAELVVRGHVEIRWSHGRFRQPPEAKIYLDTPHYQVPGYHPLSCEA